METTNFTMKPSRLIYALFALSFVATILLELLLRQVFSSLNIPADLYNSVWLSFDPQHIIGFHQKIANAGNLPGYLAAHRLDLCLALSYGLLLYSLSRIIHAWFAANPRLNRVASLFLYIALGTAIFDLIETSLILMMAGGQLGSGMPATLAQGAANLAKLALFFVTIAWIVFALTYKALNSLHRNKIQSA